MLCYLKILRNTKVHVFQNEGTTILNISQIQNIHRTPSKCGFSSISFRTNATFIPWGVTQYGTLVRIHVPKKKPTKRGDFSHILVGSQDLKKGGIFTKKGRCLTEDTPVMLIKGVLW